MGKKIVLAVFGGIALFGLLIVIVGFALGGRPGSVTVRDGQFVFANRTEEVRLANAPYWMDGDWYLFGGTRFNRFVSAITNDDYDSSVSAIEAIEATEAPAAGAGASHHSAKGTLQVDIDIPLGNVYISTGKEAELRVEGPLKYESYYDDHGVWHIDGEDSDDHRFWKISDVNTDFHVTLPASIDKLELHIGMGEGKVDGLSLDKLDCSSEMGSIQVKKVLASTADFSVSMGEIVISDFEGGKADLSCDMGHLSFAGAVSESLNADCSMGSIECVVTRPAAWVVDAEGSMANISVDGSSFAGFASNHSSHGGDMNAANPTRFDLECGMGSIDIRFS